MATKAQRAAKLKKLGIMDLSMKLEGEALQHHIGRRAETFQDRRTKRNRTRSARHASALKDWA